MIRSIKGHLAINLPSISQKWPQMWNIITFTGPATHLPRQLGITPLPSIVFHNPGLCHFYFYILIHTTCAAWVHSLSSVRQACLQICRLWQQTPRKHLDHASPLAVCPEGIGLRESTNPWITQCVCGVICWRFTHAVANVRHFSGPDRTWRLYLFHYPNLKDNYSVNDLGDSLEILFDKLAISFWISREIFLNVG